MSSPSEKAAPPPKFVTFLSSLGKKLGILIPIAMILGFITGAFVDMKPLQVIILPLTMLMVYPMMVTFKPQQAANLDNWRPVSIAMVMNFLLLPFVAWGIALLFFRDQPALFAGMVMAGLFPTSGMTISWTGFAKGNMPAAVQMTVIGLLLASLAAPFYLYLLVGSVIPVDLWSVTTTVGLVIFIPMFLGWATRRIGVAALGQPGFQRIAPAFPGLSTLGVLGIVFVAIGLKAPMIIDRPLLLAWILIPVTLFYILNYAISLGLGRALLPRPDAVSLVYGTVMRNLSIALGLSVAYFGAEAALVLSAAFIIQVQSASWMVHLLQRILPEPATNPA